jgi:nitroimidazol reductase NimA-like FMN-containing flavoprotein (pyridoxamine 5'-phosphate oxidase superfamily)
VQVDRRTGVEVIDRPECIRLLGEHVLGRLAVNEGSAPLVLPVNYGLAGDRVVIRTAVGTKLDAVHRPVCFEVDDFDRAGRSGWSVVVRGRLVEVMPADRERWEELRVLPEPWAAGDKDHVLCIEPTVISGRRIRPRPSAPEVAAHT